MGRFIYMSFEANPEQAEKLVDLVRKGVTFTHVQDKGIWRRMFPVVLIKLFPTLIEPKLEVIEPESSAPVVTMLEAPLIGA